MTFLGHTENCCLFIVNLYFIEEDDIEWSEGRIKKTCMWVLAYIHLVIPRFGAEGRERKLIRNMK